MRRIALLLGLVLLLAAPAQAQRFVAVAFHDIADTREGMANDAVTTSELVRFFDWLKGAGWTPVSLDDIAAAGAGRRALPPRAILLTFDDGYRSFHERLFPLLLAYNYPAVIALVTGWMEVPAGGTVRYGDLDLPRSHFLSWAQARAMQASGLVEFASHSHDLHRGLLGNPQGNELAAAAAWAFDRRSGRYEDDAALRRRVQADLARSAAIMRRELGRAPRALVWPFGRFAGPSIEAARAAGFRFALTLDPEPADAARPFAIGRYYPSQAPDLPVIARNLRFQEEAPPARRLLCLDPAPILDAGDEAARDEALGEVIEAIRRLGPNMVAIAAHARGPDGALGPALYPTALAPRGPDLLGRLVRQIRGRAGAETFVRFPVAAAARQFGADRVPGLAGDIARFTMPDGLLLEEVGALGEAEPMPTPDPRREATRARRAALDPATLDAGGRLGLAAMREAERLRPDLRLMVASAAEPAPGLWPAPAADYVLRPLPPGGSVAALLGAGWIGPRTNSRLLLDLPGARAALVAAQRGGATGLAYCAAGMAALAEGGSRGPRFSAATYPLRP
jgi:peptidoglycan/xylan/chitin deacetylase (PgdA/CDA1 family)